LGSGVIGEVLGATLAVIAGLSYLRGRLARDTTGLLREPWAGWSRPQRATVTLAVAMGFALLEVLLFPGVHRRDVAGRGDCNGQRKRGRWFAARRPADGSFLAGESRRGDCSVFGGV